MALGIVRIAIFLGLALASASLAGAKGVGSVGRTAPAEHSAPLRLAQFNWLGGDTAAPAAGNDAGVPMATAEEVKTDASPSAAGAATALSSAWAVTCSDRGGSFVCEMTQTIIDQKSRRPVLVLSVKHSKEAASNAMLFRLPHGIYIPAGVSVKVDTGKAAKLEFQKSDQNGIYAALPLSSELVATMKKGSEIVLGVELNKGQPFELKGQLAGFSQAYDRINSFN